MTRLRCCGRPGAATEHAVQRTAFCNRASRSCTTPFTTRVECVNELSALREPADEASLGLFALVDGLIRHRVLPPRGFALRRIALQAVERHLAGLGAQAADQPAPKVKPTRVTPP